MAQEQGEVRGPDLRAGVSVDDVHEGRPLLGHVDGEPVVLVRSEGALLRGRRELHALRRAARGRPRRRPDDPLSLASRLLRPEHGRGRALPRVRAGRLLCRRGRRWTRARHRADSGSVREGAGSGRPGLHRDRGSGRRGLHRRPRVPPRRARREGHRHRRRGDRPRRPPEPVEGVSRRQGARGLDPARAAGRRDAADGRARHRRRHARAARPADGRLHRLLGRAPVATGAEVVRLDVPGADLPHVHTLRTFADSRAIIEGAQRARRAVVVGAGFIGLEVAASLRARDIEVDVVAPGLVAREDPGARGR